MHCTRTMIRAGTLVLSASRSRVAVGTAISRHAITSSNVLSNVKSSIVVTNSYNRFDLLPHTPKGKSADDETVHIATLDHLTGKLQKHSSLAGLTNPAFMRYHQARDGSELIYVCTENIMEEGTIVGLKMNKSNMTLEKAFEVSAEGYSTCYITINPSKTKAYIVNYWDSVLGAYDILDNGHFSSMVTKWKPERKMIAHDIKDHLRARQSEPHTHALVFDPYVGNVVYVPDLGDDTLRQFAVCSDTGALSFASAISLGKHRGPRYIEFHPNTDLHVAYVVNELACTISVFEANLDVIRSLKPGDERASLTKIQEVSTVPPGFDDVKDETGHGKSTCGRVMCTKDGRFVLASNRGHDSISVHKVDPGTGLLMEVGIYKTMGKTPRHFQLSCDGRYVLVANQDTETVTCFTMNQETGELTYTGNNLHIKSPNFVLAEAPIPISS